MTPMRCSQATKKVLHQRLSRVTYFPPPLMQVQQQQVIENEPENAAQTNEQLSKQEEASQVRMVLAHIANNVAQANPSPQKHIKAVRQTAPQQQQQPASSAMDTQVAQSNKSAAKDNPQPRKQAPAPAPKAQQAPKQQQPPAPIPVRQTRKAAAAVAPIPVAVSKHSSQAVVTTLPSSTREVAPPRPAALPPRPPVSKPLTRSAVKAKAPPKPAPAAAGSRRSRITVPHR